MTTFLETFRTEHTIEQRINECSKIRKKYPTRIPVIINLKDIEIDKHKYLVPEECTLLDFTMILKRRIKCNPSEGLYYYIGEDGIIPRLTDLISYLYLKYKSPDGYLIINVSKENTFG